MTKFKSKLEEKFSKQFRLPYETNRLKYKLEHTYTPDFKVADNVFIETKGRFTSSDRSKIKHVIQQHTEITLALVFQQPTTLISKKSKTSYAVWCDKHNIQWFNVSDTQGIENFIRRHL